MIVKANDPKKAAKIKNKAYKLSTNDTRKIGFDSKSGIISNYLQVYTTRSRSQWEAPVFEQTPP